MVARVTSQFLVLVIAVLLFCNASADAPPSTLARFGDSESSLRNLIKFPAVDEDVSKVIHCRSLVPTNGRLRWTWCPPSVDSDFRFIKAILKAAKKTRVSPATVNEKTHSAYLFYRVMFAKQGEIEGIGVYPNWGYDVDKYGADYESAQRYGGRVYYTHCFISPLVLSTVKIGADGQITGGVSFSGGDSKFEKSHCARRIIKNIVGASYIPGRYDGKLVETTHVYA